MKLSHLMGADYGLIKSTVSRNYRVHICEDDKKLKNKEIWKREKAIVSKPGKVFYLFVN